MWTHGYLFVYSATYSKLASIVSDIQVILHEPVCVVEFSRCKALGRVSLRSLGRTIAVGLVSRIIKEQD